ncbi:hypothetical protein [Haladaptatus sp. NG-WS-4]
MELEKLNIDVEEREHDLEVERFKVDIDFDKEFENESELDPEELVERILEQKGFKVRDLVLTKKLRDDPRAAKECVHFTQGDHESLWVCVE